MSEPRQPSEIGRPPKEGRRSTAQDRSSAPSSPAQSSASSVHPTLTSSGQPRAQVPQASESDQNETRGFVGLVRERAGAQLATQKNRATDTLGTIAHALRETTHELHDDKHETMAEYVERAADQLERLSTRLKDKDVGELFRGAQDLARRKPAIFVGSAFALGLLGARFLKSSPPRARQTPLPSSSIGAGMETAHPSTPSSTYGERSTAYRSDATRLAQDNPSGGRSIQRGASPSTEIPR
jgi:hypothetical protein